MTFAEYMAFAAALLASFLPFRLWDRLPARLPMHSAAVVSGVLTIFAGAAVGIPGYLEHVGFAVSLANETMLEYETWHRGLVGGFSAMAFFTFLLMTPKGWATLYLSITGAIRALAAWFDDPVGDPTLTLIDHVVFTRRARKQAVRAAKEREAAEGPDVPDRVATPAAAGIPGCDFVIVSSRRKPGWEHGTAVYTQSAVYRIGLPIERTIAGRLRNLYPLTEHTDFEAIRKSVHYDLPGEPRPANERSE